MFNKKKGYDYFSTLVKMSQLALEEARLLKQIVENYDPDKLDENRQKMHAIEHDCDTLKHELSTELVKDFLPPIDREDLFLLAHVTDDLTDSVESVVVFFYMANLKAMRPDTVELCDLVVKCCESVVEMLEEFKNFKKSTLLKGLVVKLNDLEEHGDRLYIQAVRKLSTEDISTRDVIEWRDVYRNFENCFDAAETVADNIESATMKNS
ncbi:MAG: DUF47 family protein [Clostridia bacterium]|nr:DUF47 family protein [Clostridia bacterium]MBR2932939.1 DUF47 family protein [Clostridia bacterium]